MSSLSPVSTRTVAGSSATGTNANSFQQAFQNLGDALQSGDLTAAQTALQQLQKGGKGGGHHHHHAQGAAGNSVGSAFAALSTALQSGNLQSAQSAFSSLQQDLQNSPGAGQNGTSGGSTPGATSSQDIPPGTTFSIQA